MNQVPDVVHVGFSKSASTFLRSTFEEHPAVFLVSGAHFYVPFEHCSYEYGKELYASLFKDALNGQLTLESDEHIVLPLLHPTLRAAATTLEAVVVASSRIKDMQPNVKIILVVRNQLDLILSRYGEYIVGGRDCDFDEFVKEFLHCSQDGVNYYQNYYSRIIEIFHNDFSPQNVLVLFQEELARNEAGVMQSICDFLGIDVVTTRIEKKSLFARLWSLDHFTVVTRRGKQSKNIGLSYVGLKLMRVWNRIVVTEPEEAHYKKAAARVPYFFYKFVLRVIRVVDYYLPKRLKGDKKVLLTPAIVERIRAEFREDNRRLAQMLSKELTALGY